LRERYGDDPSTHPDFDLDLWMEVGLFSGPDKNRVYGLSNTTTKNLRAARSVSTVGSSQSVSSTQSKKFVALKQHTAHLTEKYDQLSANYEQFRQMVMNLTSQSGDTCALPFWSYGSRTTSLLLLLLQLRYCANLILFWKHVQFVMNIIELYFFIF
jgi:hypothetical protein